MARFHALNLPIFLGQLVFSQTNGIPPVFTIIVQTLTKRNASVKKDVIGVNQILLYYTTLDCRYPLRYLKNINLLEFDTLLYLTRLDCVLVKYRIHFLLKTTERDTLIIYYKYN